MATSALATNVLQEAAKASASHVVDPVWLQILNSNLMAALIGFMAALFVWKLTEWSQARRKRMEDQTKYLALLRAIQNELRFYKGKLGFLSKQIQDAIEAIKISQPAARPSYSLYPTFLEHMKQELSGFLKDDELVKELSHCHFELWHIVERVEWYKSLPYDGLFSRINNIEGVKGLIDSNIPVFERVADRFAKEEEKLRHAQK